LADCVGVVRAAYGAMSSSEPERMLEYVDPDLEWTYLDPSRVHPEPETCHGRAQLAARVGRAGALQLDEVLAFGEHVVVVTSAPGLDERRARKTGDRNFHLVTVRDGRIVALRACRDRAEAIALAQA
jgi:ketosteroid isomerase-like protein